MSLFSLREWWHTQGNGDEEYDKGCMVLGNVDNDQNKEMKIITGSFEGVLRVYRPRSSEASIEDLMLEEKLPAPILQVDVGRFSGASDSYCLAVLHPRQLVVYTVEPSTAQPDQDASFYHLKKLYEHNLGENGQHFTAYNMIHGPFGGSYGRDFICVQSMDCRLQFFEQDQSSFLVDLGHSLLPGPMCYHSRIDSLIFATSEMKLQCYRYQTIASANNPRMRNLRFVEDQKERDEKASAAKKLAFDWCLNAGEHIVDLLVTRLTRSLSATQADIVVLGEHSLFVLKDQGAIRSQRRLNFEPTAITAYALQQEGSRNFNLIIGTTDNQILVYNDMQLLWAAKAQSTPIAIHVGTFGSIPGMVVTLSETGSVSVNYLGTDPPSNAVAGTETKELNYAEMDAEHRKLLSIIRESQGEHKKEPRERILLRVQVPNLVDDMQDASDRIVPSNFPAYVREDGSPVKLTVRIFVTYTGNSGLSDVQLVLNVPQHIYTAETTIFLQSVAKGSGTPTCVPVTLYISKQAIPSSLKIGISALYTSAKGDPRVSATTADLSVCLAARLVPPIKNAQFKFTLDTNKDPVQLEKLFEDLLAQPDMTEEMIQKVVNPGANVLSFQYYGGPDVTVLGSKNSGRYRIQAGSLEALWLISNAFVSRMESYFLKSDSKEAPLVISYQEPLPLTDFFAVIDEHLACRKRLEELMDILNDRCHQYRVIQKRLLVRFKEKTPTPLNNLDALLHDTHSSIMDLAAEVERAQAALRQASVKLSCCCQLNLLLIRYKFNLNEESFQILHSHMYPDIEDNQQQGWEERVDASVSYLLKTLLSKSNRDTLAPTPELVMPQDTSKLKKHITLVCDRLSKGATLSRNQQPERETKSDGIKAERKGEDKEEAKDQDKKEQGDKIEETPPETKEVETGRRASAEEKK